MDIRRFDTNERSSQATAAGGIVFTAGQVARDNAGADIATQTREALARTDVLLARANSDRTRLLSATIWLRDADDYKAMNEAWVEWLPDGTAPARAVIQSSMINEGWDIEIAVVAAANP